MEKFIIPIIGISVIIAIVAILFLKVKKMSKEEKTELLKTFLYSAVIKAEKELGSGKGKEKLKEAEKYFEEKAPVYYKVILFILGKDSLNEIIESALADVKKYFGA